MGGGAGIIRLSSCLCSSLNNPVPIAAGIPRIIRSETPSMESVCP